MTEGSNLYLDLLRPRSDPRRGEAFLWALSNLDKVKWVGLGASKMKEQKVYRCSKCKKEGHNKRTCEQDISDI